ncbi:hypothetical protein ColTof4_01482 [Colletotrichum tofieldiae]|nr:hypothetical protein ColTof3_08738 [Colletotrichum tofieldiae]GKT69059.1 hypothetical protein ColTof4_01482 [Colletotrichum tofieldiae]
MHRIYQQAEGIDIWLGLADDNEAPQVTDVLRYAVDNADLSISENWSRLRRPGALLPHSEWDVLASFFSRQFALASYVRIMLGNDYIDCALLWHATIFLYSLALPLPLHYGQNHSAGYAIVQHCILRKCVKDTDQLLSLLPTFATREMQMLDYETVLAWVFWRSAAMFATDTRDYIYGILGVADTIMDRLAQAMGC